jgi:dUTP pyrophosphatase
MTEVNFRPSKRTSFLKPNEETNVFYDEEIQKNSNNIIGIKKEEKIILEIVNRSNNSFPRYEHQYDSGFDLRAWITSTDENVIKDPIDGDDYKYSIQLKPFETRLFHTGIYIKIPYGYEGQVRTRSGMALKQRLIVTNSPGTIDYGYNGEVCVILTNLNKNSVNVENGYRIAQFVLCPVLNESKVNLVSVGEINTDTERGTGGFGHTGYN